MHTSTPAARPSPDYPVDQAISRIVTTRHPFGRITSDAEVPYVLAMLVWVTLAAGSVVILLGTLAVMRVDRRWRRSHLQCCRCLDTWFGHAKICERCGGRGSTYDWLAVRYAGFPTHDWQGYLDTGPIPVIDIAVPAQRTPEPAAAERQVELSDR